uniref:Uncharacterized protein n=1 Tax=viral metagenome TaxID=1070528 RepID=A0A6C0I7V7_9ZZZZ
MDDIIDISLDFESLDGLGSSSKKTNFGGGLELLMNDKQKSSAMPSSDIDIDDLNNLENELNDLANTTAPSSNNFDSGLFGVKTSFDDKPSVRFDESPSVGKSTTNTDSDSKTWDGYGKFNNIPVNPDIHMTAEPKLTKEEMMREKFKYLRKLEALERKGVELTKKYNMESNLAEMQGEYEMIMEEKERQNSMKFQGNMMMAIINGMEFLNNRFDPFDIKLDGWGEQINENITDYDEIFGQLHDKYKSKASMSPELKLLFQLGGSAMMVHMTNTMFKSAMPGMDDIMRQNPDLMRQFQSAAVNSMGNANPGFSGFMSGLMDPPQTPSGRGPPPPLATQGANVVPPQGRAGNNASMGRSNYFNDNSSNNDGISIKESSFSIPGFEPPQPANKSSRRPDMKGPGDITDILSGLKTKTINISEPPPSLNNNNNDVYVDDNNSSTISINDLKDIQTGANVPKRSKRKPKSDKNTVSLDI